MRRYLPLLFATAAIVIPCFLGWLAQYHGFALAVLLTIVLVIVTFGYVYCLFRFDIFPKFFNDKE